MARAYPVTEERPSLYERDFYLWIEQQASRLREGRLDQLDVANLLEEIEEREAGHREQSCRSADASPEAQVPTGSASE